MIKTLRITSIMAAILAAVFLVFSAAFGVRSDEQVEEFLRSAGAIEEFNKAKGEKIAKSRSQVSPLVKQAEDFALYLNPPPKPKPRRPARESREPSVTPKPRAVSAKFTLKGTSYYPSHPELSLALIDEPGKDMRWVRQSGKVGHLIIEQVRDGLVVVRDGQRTFELAAERPEKKSLLKGPASGEMGSKSILTPSGKADGRITSRRTARMNAGEKAALAKRRSRPKVPPSGETDSKAKPVLAPLDKRDTKITRDGPPQISAEEDAFDKLVGELKAMRLGVESGKVDSEPSDEEDPLDEFVSKLKALQMGGESGEIDSGRSDEESNALMDEIISELEAMHISAEEAKKLNHLGKELKDVEQEPDRAEPDSSSEKK